MIPSTLHAQFSSWMQKRRRALGYSQADLSKKCGVSLPMIQLIEANQANPSLETTEKILSALELRFQLAPKKNLKTILAEAFGLLQKKEFEIRSKKQLIHLLTEISLSENEINHNIDKNEYEHQERAQEAYQAILLCIQEYYPSLMKNLPKVEFQISGRIVKLKRMALPTLLGIMR